MTAGRRELSLILATQALDHAYAQLDRLRSSLVLAFASDAALDRFNEWTYGRAERYRPGAEGFRRNLFPWEEHAVAGFFPPPPARLLIGGAGAGREALALAERGYRIVAFEPVPALAAALARQADIEGKTEVIQAFRGGYEDLPQLTPVSGGPPVAVEDRGPIDAAILGWGSFSHLRSEGLRRRTLSTFARLTGGPILASFIAVRSSLAEGEATSVRAAHPGALARLIERRGRRTEDRFSIRTGYQHPVTEDEVAALAGAAGLEVVELQFSGAETYAPYVVLRRR